ncbi:MAG: alpha/beta fold hydrolase [Promethearchaeota archaeon]
MIWQDNIEERFIPTNGINMHTILIGDRAPLVMLHGFPYFWYAWKDLIPLIKNKFKLKISDLRSYKLSDKRKDVENYRVDILIEDIIDLIRQ